MSQLLHFPSSPLFPAWENNRGWTKALGPYTYVGDLEEVPGSWLHIGSAPAVVLTWGVNQQMEDLYFCLYFFL